MIVSRNAIGLIATIVCVLIVVIVSLILIGIPKSVTKEADWNGSVTIELENNDIIHIEKGRIRITENNPKNEDVLDKYNNKDIKIDLKEESPIIDFIQKPKKNSE